MLEIQNLSRSFGAIKAVNKVSFSVSGGEIVGFLGPNGAGKTTTMRMMVGWLQPDEGAISLGGKSIFADPLAASARIGYLPENNPLYGEMAVGEFLRYFGELRRMNPAFLDERLEFVRAACGLDGVWKQRISTLSKGYRQRTGLAQAILHDPEVLILDEPTGGLDPNQIIEIRELIRQLGKEKTVLLSSHIMQEVQALCSRVIIINKGRIIVDDSIENLGAHISGLNRVIIELEAQEPDFSLWLEQKEGVSLESVEQSGAIHRFRFLSPPEQDIRRELTAFVLEKGWQLVSIYQEKQSLESIFHELTSQEAAEEAQEQIPFESDGVQKLVAELHPIDGDLTCPESDPGLPNNNNNKDEQ
ncbi:MAG: ATP-binding cassette domain-containing protein [Candidatus Cloacimonetes bacterium]|nr:ATP-binding cassette domain-containing protein [Candidatus Cloacimonadota bacterium]